MVRPMTKIPRSALILGLSGLLPFLFAAVLTLTPEPKLPPGQFALIYPTDARAIFAGYGTVILCFMSGVLWGFAAKGPADEQALGYVLSVIPALYAFFFCQPHVFALTPNNLATMRNLIVGFVGLLAFDWYFTTLGSAPQWWMRLRLLLTAIVVVCLLIGWLGA